MTSSAADRFVGAGVGGGGGGEEQMLLHHPQMYYHVPQHSRREKLRFPQEEPPQPAAAEATAPLLLLHDPISVAQPLYPANSLTAFFPSLSSSSAASPYFSQNPALGYGGGVAQFDEHVVDALPIPAAQPPPPPQHHQILSQGFSLSLSSSSSPRPPPPRPHLAGRPAPLGPFTGYAAVLNRSRFVDPARRLLEEVCGVGHAGRQAAGGRDMLLDADPPKDSLAEDGFADYGMKEDRPISSQQWKKSRLLSMLDEVYRRYKQYYQQVQAVITSFESVAGLSTAAPYASMALKAMAKHFRCLKNIISEQLHQANKGLGNEGTGRAEEISNLGLLESTGYLQRTTTTNSAGTFAPPHVWRPQRGLPERAVSVLRSWLFEHFLHPYPTDVDKQNLAKQTGLTRNQVSNWFINARVRLWKPMVEEIHSLEMRQKNKTSSAAAAAASDNHRSHHSEEQTQPPPPSSKMNPFDHHTMLQIMNTQGNQFSAAKGVSPGELTPMPHHFHAPGGFDMSSHQHVDVGIGGGNGVSLTLGLHQNNGGVRFPEPVVPINVVRRFGLEECNEGYLVNAFGEQERGSRLLHDFVG